MNWIGAGDISNCSPIPIPCCCLFCLLIPTRIMLAASEIELKSKPTSVLGLDWQVAHSRTWIPFKILMMISREMNDRPRQSPVAFLWQSNDASPHWGTSSYLFLLLLLLLLLFLSHPTPGFAELELWNNIFVAPADHPRGRVVKVWCEEEEKESKSGYVTQELIATRMGQHSLTRP